MLFTANVSDLNETTKKIKIYYLIGNRGNDEVVPDQADLDFYRSGVLTWEGLKLNYMAKITKPEAIEWMEQVSAEAVSEDIVLVDEEKDENYSCRTILVDIMKNMYTGQFNFEYAGEITNK